MGHNCPDCHDTGFVKYDPADKEGNPYGFSEAYCRCLSLGITEEEMDEILKIFNNQE